MFKSINQIIATNKKFGGHFFDRDAMKFFKGRVLKGVYGGAIFITSERFRFFDRAYSIRYCNSVGSIQTIDYMKYRTRRQAISMAKKYAKDPCKYFMITLTPINKVISK